MAMLFRGAFIDLKGEGAYWLFELLQFSGTFSLMVEAVAQRCSVK